MRPLTLVACCSQKAPSARAAKDLYISALFAKSRVWAERRGEWRILSALHGVVSPDDVIAPYDVTLTTMPLAQRREWNVRVSAALAEYAAREIVALAGERYLGWVGPAFPHVSLPLQGLGIGQRLAWLKRENDAAAGIFMA